MVTLGKVPVPAPPLDEQEKILSYLNVRDEEFDPLIEEAANTIKLMKERGSVRISVCEAVEC
jgi:type I restriction enzyme S subunit